MTEENFKKTRIARDSLGEVEIDAGALYGAQTQRAVNNFPISNKKMPEAFINSLIMIKSNAAKTNIELEAQKKLALQQLETQIEELSQLIKEKLVGKQAVL